MFTDMLRHIINRRFIIIIIINVLSYLSLEYINEIIDLFGTSYIILRI